MSKFIIGNDRSQIPLFASSMEQAIAQDNQVRLINFFVDSLKLADFGFDFTFVENGRIALFYGLFLTRFKAFYAVVNFKRKNNCSGNRLYLLQN